MTRRPGEVVGVLGGTFNPVHVGHVVMARECSRRLGLRRILFVPCATPPHKPAPSGVTLADRLAMLERAIAGEAGFEVSPIEAHAGVVCYTIDTLRRLRHGGWGFEPVFLIGADSLLDLPTWKDNLALISEFDFAVLGRGTLPRTAQLDDRIRRHVFEVSGPDSVPADLGAGGRILRLDVTPPAVSSREIRRRIAAGKDLDGLVPPEVARYIRDNLLYRGLQEEKH